MKSRKRVRSRAKAGKPVRQRGSSTRKSVKPAKAKAARRVSAPDMLDEFIRAGAHELSLTIEKSWMKAVRTNLRVTLDLASMVAEFPLPDDAEPAPVFRA